MLGLVPSSYLFYRRLAAARTLSAATPLSVKVTSVLDVRNPYSRNPWCSLLGVLN
jgi:hypothetical protein